MKKKRKIKRIKRIIIVFILLLLGLNLYQRKFREENKNLEPEVTETVFYSDDPLVNELLGLGKDEKVFKIVENKDKYPQDLLELLTRNKDMLDYVYHYQEKLGVVTAQTIGDVKKGEYPLLLQYDEGWGYGLYGGKALAINGCGPTALAIVIAGLKGINTVTPIDIAKYAEENGYYTELGTSWSLMTKGIKKYGISGKMINLNKGSMINELESGHPIICSMKPGDFTTKGHFIALVGYSEDKFIVRDPNSKERSSKLWDYETLAPQIKNLWAFQLNF